MKTTVIIPNYNGVHFLKDCFDSLLANVDTQFQIIFVDNGSSDDSVGYVKQHYPAVRIISRKGNGGFSVAVNEGILQATTDYVLLLNNDTMVDKHFVYEMQSSIENANCFSVSARMMSMKQPQIVDNTGDLYSALGWAFSPGASKLESYAKTKRPIFSACAGAAIYQRKILVELGLFDENHFAYLEDVDVGYRARIHGYYNQYEENAICYHFGSGFSGSKHNAFKVTLSAQNSIYLIYKNMALLQIVINAPFLVCGFVIKMIYFHKKGLLKAYLEGLRKGMKLCGTKSAKEKKIKFKTSFLKNYFWIQMELWWNVLRRFIG